MSKWFNRSCAKHDYGYAEGTLTKSEYDWEFLLDMFGQSKWWTPYKYPVAVIFYLATKTRWGCKSWVRNRALNG